ncbi:hypothetical protein LOTGIDRAFT_115778 [Lottia gigantea]|uniref:Ig-like domain-containing protein n=1 Tax=Lottia gigantea TaxID=225164 RepID=V4AS31_LOTGI|nr:hypothetical protein LOTGIDRAFT_115778 [Lottia gigantea]ESO96521.1 hypothetical protein LOTGIDRAFT_115778 [Lottia gigantea]
MYYRWEREDYGLPSNVTFDDSMRIMIIHNAKLEDSGTYTCHVRRGKSNTAKKTILLSVEAKPYFMFPLKNQHLDKGVKISWKCLTIAVPRATYTWYKDTKILTAVPGDYEVKGNVLTIESVDKQHEGMYQCRAENTHGVIFSSAQLRILSFPPSFSKHPVKSTVATEGGNITLICSPEGAPFPTITWQKDGSEMGLSVGSSNGKHIFMPNGNLIITQLSQSDSGEYTCTATNDLGSDTSSATIYITSKYNDIK